MSGRPVVGVFDSGFGGLTVLRELLEHLPGADYLYLGDTAHLPYGSKSQEAVTEFTNAAVERLVLRGAERVVIACNTASALALPHLIHAAPVPLTGVIEPGALAAAAMVAPGGTALVLATEATVASHAYERACAAYGVLTVEIACPLFVPLVEEGWTDGIITEQIARVYLSDAFASFSDAPGAVVLGCTHYPLLRPVLRRVVEQLAGPVPLVDSAEATARHVADLMPRAAGGEQVSAVTFMATDATQKFQQLGQQFLQREIANVEHIDLDTAS